MSLVDASPRRGTGVPVGAAIGSYRIVRKLGEGGMGTVYEAEHALLGRRAAIKVLLEEYSNRPDLVSRFFNEARSATAVAHAGIVQIFDFGFHHSAAYIVMEYLEGETLDARVRRTGRLDPVEAGRLCRQVATALAAAHRAGVVHRDLKPENIFLVRDSEVFAGERAKILDFGIAKLGEVNEAVFRTMTGAVIGTPAYMSPEQCRGAGSVRIDHRADIYALGCILYTLLVGAPPFEGEGLGDLIAAHLTRAPVPPSSRVADISPELDALVLRCLEKDPADRFGSMDDVADALAHIVGRPSLPGQKTTISAASVEVTPVAQRPARGIVIAAVALVSLALASVFAMTLPGHRDAHPAATSQMPDAGVVVVPIVERVPEAAPAPAPTAVPATLPSSEPAMSSTPQPASVTPKKRDLKRTAVKRTPGLPKAAKPRCAPDDLYCVE